MVPEDELDACPWASGIDISADHVILAIQLEQAPKFIFQIVSLAAQHELVCFDPQAGKVYLPPRLKAQQVAAATDSVSTPVRSHQRPSLMTNPRRAAKKALQPNPSCHIPEQ